MESKEHRLNEKDALDIAWKYFQQHASQRISYFNYFIMFSSIMTTALIATLSPQFNLGFIGVGIGAMQVLLSVIFIKIDDRNRYLTHIGECALIELENEYDLSNKNYNIKVFTNELIKSNILKSDRKYRNFYSWQLTHGQSFRVIYYSFAFAGILGSAVSMLKVLELNKNIIETPKIRVFIDYSSARRAIPISQLNPIIINKVIKR